MPRPERLVTLQTVPRARQVGDKTQAALHGGACGSPSVHPPGRVTPHCPVSPQPGTHRRLPRAPAVPWVCGTARLRAALGRTMSPTHGLTAIRSWRSRSLRCSECPRPRCLLPMGLCHSGGTQGPAPAGEPRGHGCLSFSFCVRKKGTWGSQPFPGLEGAEGPDRAVGEGCGLPLPVPGAGGPCWSSAPGAPSPGAP